MLQLPSAWSDFIGESTHGASCLGQLAGLESKKAVYKQAVDTLSDSAMTTLILVTRPESSPIKEAERASAEPSNIGIRNQIMLINGILTSHNDSISDSLYSKQQNALAAIPESLKKLESYMIPLRAYNVSGIENVRALLNKEYSAVSEEKLANNNPKHLSDLIDFLAERKKKVIFTMGKGGVGKTTIAAAIALGLSKKGLKVHLTTTDPAAHLKYVLNDRENIAMSRIDEKAELKKYQTEVLEKAKDSGMTESDLAYIEEDLRSPCTQEIAVFRAFAEIVEKADDEIVIIDTAPTGHTLLLLESTQSYDREIQHTKGETPDSVKHLLPRLKSDETEVIIITLPEATPVYEALRLEEDLNRAESMPIGGSLIPHYMLLIFRTKCSGQGHRVKLNGSTKWTVILTVALLLQSGKRKRSGIQFWKSYNKSMNTTYPLNPPVQYRKAKLPWQFKKPWELF